MKTAITFVEIPPSGESPPNAVARIQKKTHRRFLSQSGKQTVHYSTLQRQE